MSLCDNHYNFWSGDFVILPSADRCFYHSWTDKRRNRVQSSAFINIFWQKTARKAGIVCIDFSGSRPSDNHHR
jgi:hypothetical protein